MNEIQNIKPAKPLSMRDFLYTWLFDTSNPDNYQKHFDKWISILIIANLVSIVAEHIPAVFDSHKALFHLFDQFSLAVFTFEYVLRLFVAPNDAEFSRSRYPRLVCIRSPYALIDLAAILPFYLASFVQADLRVLRILRLLRLLKFFRVLIPAIQEFRQLNAGRTFRQHVYALFNATEYSGKLYALLDTFVVWWIFISVVAVVLESVDSISSIFHQQFIVLDAVAVFIFLMEYIFRLYAIVEDPRYKGSISGRINYGKSPIVIIDLLAIAPFFLERLLDQFIDLRFLRIFRLMRLLKLTRHTTSTGTLIKALKREWPVIGAATVIILLLVILTASLGYLFEHDAQPDKFQNIPQSIYWAVITLASVGYGDIAPVTPIGRLMTIIMALVGIGIFAVPAAILSSAFNDQLHKDRELMHNELTRFMKDGELDEAERARIMKEAQQLHISQEEVEILIERARYEKEQAESGHLPLEAMTKNPEIAFEQFRITVGNLRQIMAAGDRAEMHALFESPGRATDDEKAIWRQLNRS